MFFMRIQIVRIYDYVKVMKGNILLITQNTLVVLYITLLANCFNLSWIGLHNN